MSFMSALLEGFLRHAKEEPDVKLLKHLLERLSARELSQRFDRTHRMPVKQETVHQAPDKLFPLCALPLGELLEFLRPSRTHLLGDRHVLLLVQVIVAVVVVRYAPSLLDLLQELDHPCPIYCAIRPVPVLNTILGMDRDEFLGLEARRGMR